MDFEKRLCVYLKRAATHPEQEYEIAEELVDYVEELVQLAYMRGKTNGLNLAEESKRDRD